MKKLCIILLAVIMAVSAAGCSRAKQPQLYQPFVEHKLIHFTTLDEIAAFAESEDAPENFVLYDAFSILGEFDDYFVETDPFNDRYQYSLVDEKQYHFAFMVRSYKEDFRTTDKVLPKDISVENMLQVSAGATGWIYRQYVAYSYVEGDLRTIILHIDDLQVAIGLASDPIKQYPVDENGELTTFIERLVFGTEEEALEAADEFIAFFRENR